MEIGIIDGAITLTKAKIIRSLPEESLLVYALSFATHSAFHNVSQYIMVACPYLL